MPDERVLNHCVQQRHHCHSRIYSTVGLHYRNGRRLALRSGVSYPFSGLKVPTVTTRLTCLGEGLFFHRLRTRLSQVRSLRKPVLSLTEIADDIYGRMEKLRSLLSFSPLTKASQLLNCTHRPLLPTLSLKPAPDCEYASMEIPCEMILKEKFLFQVGQQGFACGQALLKWILLSSVRHHTWLVISSTKAQLSERPQKAPPADKKILCLSNLHNSRRQLGNDSKRLGIRSSWLKTLDASVRHLQAVRTWRAPHRGPYAFSLRVYATERPPYTEYNSSSQNCDNSSTMSRSFTLQTSTFFTSVGLDGTEPLGCYQIISNNKVSCSAADTDRANEIFPAENEDEDTEATVARSVFVFVSSSTLVSDCLIKYISIVCCFVVAMPSVKRETERKVNAPVDTGPSPNSDERVNNPTEGANEPTRESGSLHDAHRTAPFTTLTLTLPPVALQKGKRDAQVQFRGRRHKDNSV
ncbi:hypothetical protein T08_8479 [Trichinella sp. T8]|nr:hypothetical protein T08_8479 [Trichinella sp. T8]